MNAELNHFGVLGMKWGVRRKSGTVDKSAKIKTKNDTKELKRRDKEWARGKNTKKLATLAMRDMEKDPSFDEATRTIKNALLKVPGITNDQFINSFQYSVAKHIDEVWEKTPAMYNPSGTKRVSMSSVINSGSVYMVPKVIKVNKNIKHSANSTIDEDDKINIMYKMKADGSFDVIEDDATRSDITENELSHYGILGMKWGVRRNSSSSGLKPKKQKSEDYTKNKALRKKKINQMSNAELRIINERMQLERSYKDLKAKDISKGRAIAKNMVKTGSAIAAATTTAITLYNNAEKIKSIVGK